MVSCTHPVLVSVSCPLVTRIRPSGIRVALGYQRCASSLSAVLLLVSCTVCMLTGTGTH